MASAAKKIMQYKKCNCIAENRTVRLDAANKQNEPIMNGFLFVKLRFVAMCVAQSMFVNNVN